MFKSLMFSILFLSLFSFASAQNISGLEAENPIEITTIPENPGPYEKVKVRLAQRLVSPAALEQIFWVVDGEALSEYNNETEATIETGALGERTNIRVLVRDRSFGTFDVSRNIYPLLFDLLIESTGYAPDSYDGRIVPVVQTPTRAVALVSYVDEAGVRYNENDFLFSWSINGRSHEYRKRGRNSLTFSTPSISGDQNISVEVSLPQRELDAGRNVSVSLGRPRVFVYRDDPIYGLIVQRALSGPLLVQNADSVTLSIQPLFFPKQDFSSGEIDFSWLANGTNLLEEIQSVLVQSVGSSENVFVQASAINNNSAKYLQSGGKNLSLKFE